jgi:hypothetical protein
MGRPPILARMKQEYRRLFDDVRSILNRYDLMRLIAMGCPEDEYEPEVERILPRLRDARDAGEVAVTIQDVFTRMFNERQDESEVARAAEEIWAIYHARGRPPD